MRAGIGGVIISLVALAAILAPLLTSNPPNDRSLSNRFAPPFWQEKGSLSTPLGTDNLGRDVWSRLVYGARPALIVPVGALVVGGVLGTALGLVVGRWRGFWDRLFEWSVPWTIVISFPQQLLAVMILVTIGWGTVNLVVALALVTWPAYAGVVRRDVIARDPFSDAPGDRDAGSGDGLTFSIRNLIALVPHRLALLVVLESIPSFLGIGIREPGPSWGLMVADGRNALDAWWISGVPLAAIILLAAGFYLVGNRLGSVQPRSPSKLPVDPRGQAAGLPALASVEQAGLSLPGVSFTGGFYRSGRKIR